MSNAEQLSKLTTSRESFEQAIQFTVDLYLKGQFHQDFVRETAWQMEGQFQKFLQVTKEAIDEIYTPEEIDILIELNTKYPWMASKAETLGQVLTDKSIELGQTTGDTVIANLEETGDLERILEEGFYIGAEEEIFNEEDEV